MIVSDGSLNCSYCTGTACNNAVIVVRDGGRPQSVCDGTKRVLSFLNQPCLLRCEHHISFEQRWILHFLHPCCGWRCQHREQNDKRNHSRSVVLYGFAQISLEYPPVSKCTTFCDDLIDVQLLYNLLGSTHSVTHYSDI